MTSITDITDRVNVINISHCNRKIIRKRSETMLCCEIHGWVSTWNGYRNHGGCPGCNSKLQYEVDLTQSRLASLCIK